MWKNRCLKALVALAWLAVGIGAQPIRGASGLRNSQATATALIAEVNALRASNGLPAYTVSPILMGTAQAQADYMAATGSITHSGPGGITLTQRLLNAGYPLAGDLSLGGFRAENITGGRNKTAAQAVQEWTGDAPHLNTMLSPNLMEIGAGVAKVGDMVYLVIDCARPTTSGQPQAYTPIAGDAGAGAGGISPGDFMLPVTTSTPDADGKIFHEVQTGQTLWALAIAYGVKIDEIRALNDLGPEAIIYQGDRLLVGVHATPTLAHTATTQPVPATSTQTASASAPTVPSPVDVISPPGSVKVEGRGENSPAGMIVGMVLLAIVLAGIVTRFVANRSV